MNEQLKVTLIVIVSIFIGASAFTYGALTANPEQQPSQAAAPEKTDLKKLLKSERPTIISVLTTAYPKINTDYIVSEGKLYEKGEWYGTTLTYKGKDSLNRDTLRVLMQKKQGAWVLRTTPPQMLLSIIDLPDVPKQVIQSINQPISLPAGKDSPEVKS